MKIIDQIYKYWTSGYWPDRIEGNIKYLTVHYSAYPSNNLSNEQRLSTMQSWHVSKGWPGLSYHYAIMKDGKIYQINKHTDVTWHDTRNYDTLGILVDGYFHAPHNEHPSQVQLASLDWLISKLLNDLNLPRDRVRGHRDWSATSCPGDILYPTIQKLKKSSLNLNNNKLNSNMDKKQILWDTSKNINWKKFQTIGLDEGHHHSLYNADGKPDTVINSLLNRAERLKDRLLTYTLQKEKVKKIKPGLKQEDYDYLEWESKEYPDRVLNKLTNWGYDLTLRNEQLEIEYKQKIEEMEKQLEEIKNKKPEKLPLDKRNLHDTIRQIGPLLTTAVGSLAFYFSTLPPETQDKLFTELNAGNISVVVGTIGSILLSYLLNNSKNKRKIEEEQQVSN